MSELTDAAKAEIKEAIRIIREDKFEQYVRSRQQPEPKKEPEKDPVFDPPKDPDPKNPVDPPPPKPKDPDPDPEPKGRRSAYWGEIFDD